MKGVKMNINRDYQGGFTLIELIVVVAIMGILVAVVAIRMNSSVPTIKLDAATSQIKEHIRLAQSRAELRQEKYLISFDTSDNTYGVYESSKYPSGNPIEEATSGNYISYDLDTDDPIEGGSIDSISNFGSSGTGQIEFDARGQPYDGKGGSLLISDEARITIKYDSNSSTIKVEPITGNVSIQ